MKTKKETKKGSVQCFMTPEAPDGVSPRNLTTKAEWVKKTEWVITFAMESVNKAKNNSSCDGAVFRKVGGAILHHLKPHRICQLFANLPTKSRI
ncbi:MAG: hypothetical protein ACJAU9_000598 [Lentimonas sp.]|jgi:hypothetical protein